MTPLIFKSLSQVDKIKVLQVQHFELGMYSQVAEKDENQHLALIEQDYLLSTDRALLEEFKCNLKLLVQRS